MNKKLYSIILFVVILFTGLFFLSFNFFHHILPNNGKVIEGLNPNIQQISNDANLNNLNLDTSKSTDTNNNISINVPVLMYHYIRNYTDQTDKIGVNLSVSPENFSNQLKWLKDNGYQSVNLDYLIRPNSQISKPVILTFDDGYVDAFTNALPILKKYNFTATFYVITNFAGTDRYMNWDQINTLKSNGMIIGSHTLSHPNLTTINDAKAEMEISDSQKILEKNIGLKITDFCYPSGKYNASTIDLLKKYNYTTATTTKSGIYDSTINNLFEIPRLRMTNETNLSKILSQ
jgi:peptidoglycan/xylan/chitin deacetylase (PgdA/CDA1 family)